jgi:hypothetical protein
MVVLLSKGQRHTLMKKTVRLPNFLPWLRIFLSKKGTMKVYKLKRKYRGIIANMNLDCLKLILITILPWLIKVLHEWLYTARVLGK